MMQCSLWEGGRGEGAGILSIMTRSMNEKDEMSITSADLALERSISVLEIREVMVGRVVAELCSTYYLY